MPRCTAFAGTRRVASGDLQHVAVEAKALWDRDKWAQVLIFDDVTSNLVEVDFRGSAADVERRIAEQTVAGSTGNDGAGMEGDARRPGRPRLGVVAREVTLLPRHWDWLGRPPRGASGAPRKPVEEGTRGQP